MVISLFQVFLLGSFSSFLMVFIYNWVFILLYILTITTELNIFFYSISTIFTSWIWVAVTLAILYAFVIILSSVMKIRQEWLYNFIINLLFFVITMLNIVILASYIPNLAPIFSSENRAIYISILSVSFIFIGIIFSYTIKIATFKLYNFMVNINTYHKNIYSNGISNEYNMFFDMFSDALLFGKKNELAVGIVGFKIYNHLDIIEKYGRDVYYNLEEEFVTSIKYLSRGRENQCFLYNNTVYSLVYANENEAQKCLKRYNILLRLHEFTNDGVTIPTQLVSAISGVDFSRSKMRVSVDTVIENMMKSVNELLLESKGKESSVMYY